MAEERTAVITLRRPVHTVSEHGDLGNTKPQTGFLTVPQIIDGASEEIRSLKEGGQVSAYSFNDAVAAASIFYGLQIHAEITIQVDQEEEPPPKTGDRVEPSPQPPAREHRKASHSLATWALCTIRIMWFSIRHPGKAAWINHSTGKVWPAN